MASLEQPPQGLTGLGGFGRHHWPVTLRHGPVILAPLRHRDRAAWERVRRENAELAATVGGNSSSWLADRTIDVRGTGPFGDPSGPRGTDAAVAGVLRRCVEPLEAATGGPADGERDRWRLGVLGPDRLLDRPAAGGTRHHSRPPWRWPSIIASRSCHCIASRSRSGPRTPRAFGWWPSLAFRPEGLRPRYLHIDGDWRDHLVFALNAEEVPEGLCSAGRTAPAVMNV